MQQIPIDKITNTIFLIGGFLLSVVTRFGYGFVDEYFDKRRVRRKKKSGLAEEIIAVCTEGAGVGYNAMPSSQEHIQYIAAQVEGLDKSVAGNLRAYLGCWIPCAIRQTTDRHKNEGSSWGDTGSCANLRKKAKSLEDLILEKVRKWE